MFFLSSSLCNTLNFPDWRVKFFIESYLEALSIKTPHFHQAKLMSIIDLANEVIENIEAYQENDKGKGYLVSSLKELKIVFEQDIVAQILFGDINDIFKKCTDNFSTEKFPRALVLQLSILCKRISSQKENYFTTLKENLRDSILETVDLTQKDRITKKINLLTRLYITYLLSAGYSPTFLYNKGEMFTRKNNYFSRNFSQQLDMFLQTLNCKVRKFEVFYGVKTNKISKLLAYKSFNEVEFMQKIPDKHYTISTKTFSKFEPDLYLKIKIEALDYVSSAWKASELIECEYDYLQTMSQTIQLTFHNNCYVEYTSGDKFQRIVKIDLLNNLLLKDQTGNYLSNFLDEKVFTKIESQSKKKLAGAMKNIRMARSTARIEQKLLNLWIAFETLNYSSNEQSIISTILNYTPKLYAINSIFYRVKYLRLLLSQRLNKIPQSIILRHNLSNEKFEKEFDINLFINIIADEDSAKEIYSALNDEDLVNYRLIALHKLISNPECIATRITNTKDDIEKQIYRIYKFRNNIIHNGHTKKLSHYVINHLIDYIYTILVIVFDSLVNTKHFNSVSLDDILLSSHLVVDNKFRVLKSKEFTSLNELENHSIII